MSDDPMTSAAVLRQRQYAAPDNLAARQAFWTHRVDPDGYYTERLDALGLIGAETVLDVGCGNGRYLAELRRRHGGALVGLDLSPGMAAAAATASGAAVAVADAAHLPVATGAVDAALAMHMLYHVPDPSAAIAELRRVVRPGGALLASTNGHRHIVEVLAVIDAAVRAVTGRERSGHQFSFTLESGAALLSPSFEDIDTHETVEEVRIPEPAPVVAYIASFGPEHIGFTAPDQWRAFLTAATDLVHERTERDGAFLVTSHTGHFVCR